MKKTYCTYIILSLMLMILDQTALSAFQGGGDDGTYIYEARVNLRDQPSLNGKKVALALMGEEVEVLEKTGVQQEIYGETAYWYKITFKEKVCYVWGGLISDGGLPIDFAPGKDHGVILTKLSGGKCHIRLVKNNREVKTFTLDEGSLPYIGDFEASKNPVVLLSFPGKGGDYGQDDIITLYYYSNNTISRLTRYTSRGEIADAFYNSTTEGSYSIEQQYVIIREEMESQSYNPDTDQTEHNQETTEKVFYWDGNTFVEEQ